MILIYTIMTGIVFLLSELNLVDSNLNTSFFSKKSQEKISLQASEANKIKGRIPSAKKK